MALAWYSLCASALRPSTGGCDKEEKHVLVQLATLRPAEYCLLELPPVSVPKTSRQNPAVTLGNQTVRYRGGNYNIGQVPVVALPPLQV